MPHRNILARVIKFFVIIELHFFKRSPLKPWLQKYGKKGRVEDKEGKTILVFHFGDETYSLEIAEDSNNAECKGGHPGE
jgi:hypothetical protein